MAQPYHSDVKLAQDYARKASHTFSQRGIPYLLSFDEYVELQQVTRCAVSGVDLIKFKSGEHQGKPIPNNAHTVDRIDPAGPYSQKNCMVVSHIVNNTKGMLDQFIQHKELSTEAKLALLYKAENILRRRIKEEKAVMDKATNTFKSKFGMIPKSK